MSNIAAIDPGALGGIAWKDDTGYHAIKMPDTPKDIYDKICEIKTGDMKCAIEKVGGYVPGNSGPAAVKFARHCGHLDLALIAAEVPTVDVAPSVWQRAVIGSPIKHPPIPKATPVKERARILAKRKTERKNKIKDAMQRRFPGLKVTLKTADALGILVYAEGLYESL